MSILEGFLSSKGGSFEETVAELDEEVESTVQKGQRGVGFRAVDFALGARPSSNASS